MKNNIAIELYDKNIPLAFDLDDTLYKEFDFLSRAYLDISKSLYNDDWEDAYNYLCNEFKKKGRKNLFNKLISYKNINNIKIDDCLRNPTLINIQKIKFQYMVGLQVLLSMLISHIP